MFRKKIFSVFIIFLFVSSIFFNKTLIKGEIPFPGDLIVGSYSPYNSYAFMGYAPGGYPHKAQNIDVVEQLYPWKYLSIDLLKKGEFPLWNPYNFSGTPHLAAIQSGTFYPLNLLFLTLPFVIAWTIYIVLQPILAGVFTYLFLREIKLSYKASIFGGIIFSFSSFLVVWMQYGNIIHAVIWLPLVLWLGLKNLSSPSLVKSILIAVSLSMSIFAGHFQIALYLYLFSFIFLSVTAIKFYRKELFSKLINLIAIYIFSTIIGAIQILPSVEIFINSSRSNYTFERLVEFLIPPYHLVTILFPDFFGNPVSRNYYLAGTYIERVSYFGIIPLFFAFYAFFIKKNYYFWFFISSAVAVFFITFDTFVTRFLYSIYIPPVIASSVPTRIMFIFIFSLCVVGAFGFDHFEKLKKISTLFKSSILFLGIITSIWAIVYFFPNIIPNYSAENIVTTKRNLIIPTGVFILFIILAFLSKLSFNKIKKHTQLIIKATILIIFALTIFELYFFFQKFSPFSPKESIYPENSAVEFIKNNQGEYRSWGYGAANIIANIQTFEKIYSTDGYDPFYIKRYGELMASTENGKIPTDIKRANAALSNGYGEDDLKNNKYRQKMMNLIGIKYVLHKKEIDNHAFDKTFDENIYELVWNGNGLQIYENKNVLPRAFVVTEFEVLNDGDEIISTIYNDNFDTSKKIILEKNPPLESQSINNTWSAEITNYSENKVEVNVKTNQKALLFLSDAYFPGWKAYINNTETEIYRADYAFRAVVVPAGESNIIFKYEPFSFEIGKWVSFISIILISAILIIKSRK